MTNPLTSDTNRKWWTLAAVCTAIFMLLLDITIVNVALPQIQTQLHTTFTDLQWIIDAYALALATVVLNAGALADRYGRKRLFLLGVGIFTVASLLCGAAISPLMLIIFRAVQGFGGAFMFATSLALLAQDFHGKERGTAFGIWGAVTGAAVAIGPLAGGLLTDGLDWRWIFYVNLPIGIITLVIGMRKLVESKNNVEHKNDWGGVILLSAALFSLVYGLIKSNDYGLGSDTTLGLLGVSVALFIAFIINESKIKEPVFKLGLFRIPSFVGAQIAAISISASIFSMFLYITLYLQNVLEYSALQAGVRLLPTTLASFFTAAIAGRLSSRIPARYLIGTGLTFIGTGLGLMYGISDTSPWTHLLPGLLLSGFGIGMVNPPLASVAIGVVSPRDSGTASGINSTFRQVGIAGGIAALGAVFQNHIHTALSHVPAIASLDSAKTKLIDLAVSAGQIKLVAAQAPAQFRSQIIMTTKDAFISGLNELILIASIIAFAGAILTFILIRQRDQAVYEHPKSS
jgi:EmrB/QacA subfamily drug resistance transporter